MRNLYNETIQVMKKYNVTANKSYGQNFLIDENIIQNIIEKSELTKDDFVIEIGPGLGTLTQFLLQGAGKVLSIELDKKMVSVITDRFSKELENNDENQSQQKNNSDSHKLESIKNNVGLAKLEIIYGDILKINLHEVVSNALKQGYKSVKVIANLPYYITTPIIMKLLEEKLQIESITVMVQKEVAERLAEIPGGKETGAITYSIYYYTDAKILINVPKESFIPAPEVTSSVIQFKILKEPRVKVSSEEQLFKLIKQGFLMKRKTLVNALAGFQNKEKSDIINILNELNIDEKVRAEQLSLEDFVRISQKIS